MAISFNSLALFCLCCLLFSGCRSQSVADTAGEQSEWVALFNGKDLTNWTPKFSGAPAGENFKETFRVEQGMLVVSYENYDSLDGVFGHLFHDTSFSSYKLKAEYRFIGAQVAGGPGWAFANNGLMLHCQSPESMTLMQDFPLSLEFQFLGGDGRPTGNLCTPGCHVKIDSSLRTEHCLMNFEAPSFPVGEWVTAEAVVYRDSILHHIVNGDTVLTYESPIVGGGLGGLDTLRFPPGMAMSQGRIAIQAESHPIQFRRLEVLNLSGKTGLR